MNDPGKRLAGRTAVVSGGAGDIGLAIARTLTMEGASVALGDIRPERSVRGRIDGFHYTQVDTADAVAVGKWIVRVERDLGLPSIVVPNAAIVESGSSLRVSAAALRRTLEVNLCGAIILAQAAARRLVVRRRPGRIVFIGSWAGHSPHPEIAAYCIAKAGLRMAMKCLALELAGRGILVNEVAPGFVDGGLAGPFYGRDPASRARDRRRVPVRRLMDPADVARAVLYASLPDSSHMTGSVVLVDGGLSLTSIA